MNHESLYVVMSYRYCLMKPGRALPNLTFEGTNCNDDIAPVMSSMSASVAMVFSVARLVTLRPAEAFLSA